MSRFAAWYLALLLNQKGWPKGWPFKYVESLVYDVAVEQTIMASIALGAGRPERGIDLLYDSLQNRSWTKESVSVERALSQLLERGEPFEYTGVRELAAPAPPKVPQLTSLQAPNLKVYDALLQGVS